MKGVIRNKWFILLFNLSFFVIMAVILPVHFEENDDAMMCMIANGKYSGVPDGHLVFINAVYGWVIAGLYMLTDAVEWYTLSFCIMHVLAMTGIVYVLMNKERTPLLLKVAFLLFLYIFWIRIIIAFQFTTTAGLLCFSGCLALLQPMRNDLNFWKAGGMWKVVGASAVFIASMIRFHAVGVVGLLCLPMFLDVLMKDRRYLFWLSGLLVLIFCGKYSDGLFYRSPEWAYYKEYNAVRGWINDNPNSGLVLNELPSEVSELDYELFLNFFADPQVMTLDKTKVIRSNMQNQLSTKACFQNLKQLRLYLFPILFVIIGFFGCLLSTDKQRLLPILSMILFYVVLFYIGGFHNLKYRVFLCILLPMMYQILYWYAQAPFHCRYHGIAYIFVFAAFVGVLIKYVKQDIGLIKYVNNWNREVIEEYVNPLLMGKENWRIYPYSGWAYVEYIHPFKYHSLSVRFVSLGWMAGIPLNKGVMECHRDFVDSNIICGCRVTEGPGRRIEAPEELFVAILNNYDINTRVRVVDSNEKYALFRIVSK